MRFDMRAPSIGAPPTELYAAASEMAAWAETRGCVAAVLCEHHCADDGYLPSPLLLGSAIAARTERLMLNLVIILPFYDVARLAEDMSVLDHISEGRASFIFGIGYRQEEFDHFGLSLSDRGRLADQKLGQLRRLLSGEEVAHDGRRMRVTPQPRTPGGPMMMWGVARAWPPHVVRAETAWVCWPTAAYRECEMPTRRTAGRMVTSQVSF